MLAQGDVLDVQQLRVGPDTVPEGNMTYAKNPRELHLDFNSSWYALKASEKILVAKELVRSRRRRTGWKPARWGGST